MGGARRSGRITKEIPIVLLGTDTAGRVFSENTTTLVLSRHGAGILCRSRPDPNENLTIRFRGGSTEVAVRLVGDMGEDARGYVYGVAFVDSELDFWELKFPAAQWPVDIALECSVCQTPEIVDQCEIEADVYVLAGYVLRFCSICGTSTEWRGAGRHVEIASVAKAGRQSAISPLNRRDAQEDRYSPPQHVQTPRSIHVEEVAELVETRTMQTPALRHEFAASTILADPALPATATSSASHKANRRRDVRPRVSFTACVRQAATEQIVECDNISRGGLSFRSRKSYALGSLFEVAVPYSPGSPAIFVSATIRHIEFLHLCGLFRYGASYWRKSPVESPAAFEHY